MYCNSWTVETFRWALNDWWALIHWTQCEIQHKSRVKWDVDIQGLLYTMNAVTPFWSHSQRTTYNILRNAQCMFLVQHIQWVYHTKVFGGIDSLYSMAFLPLLPASLCRQSTRHRLSAILNNFKTGHCGSQQAGARGGICAIVKDVASLQEYFGVKSRAAMG